MNGKIGAEQEKILKNIVRFILYTIVKLIGLIAFIVAYLRLDEVLNLPRLGVFQIILSLYLISYLGGVVFRKSYFNNDLMKDYYSS